MPGQHRTRSGCSAFRGTQSIPMPPAPHSTPGSSLQDGAAAAAPPVLLSALAVLIPVHFRAVCVSRVVRSMKQQSAFSSSNIHPEGRVIPGQPLTRAGLPRLAGPCCRGLSMVQGTEETEVGATGSTNPWPQGVKAQECVGRMPHSTQHCQISPHPDKSSIRAAACAHRSSLPPHGSPKYPLLLREGGRQQQTHHPPSQGNLKLNTCPFPPLRNLSHPRGAATSPASCRSPAAGDAPVHPGQAETSTRCSPQPCR